MLCFIQYARVGSFDAEDPRWLCVVVEPHATFSCISTYFSSLRRRQETRYIQRVSPTPADTTDNLIPTDARRRKPAPGGREGKGMETLERGGGVMVAAGEGRKTRIRRYVCGSCESGLLSRARSPGHVGLLGLANSSSAVARNYFHVQGVWSL